MAAIVYLATNKVNGKRYIGVTSRGFDRRRREHEKAPNAKRTTCRYFHAAMKKYGAAAFDWMTLAEFETFEDGLCEEVRLISEIKPEYNLTTGGQGSKGRVVSPEQRARHSQIMKGFKKTPEQIERQRAAQMGRAHSAETKRKISAARKGIVFTAEHLKNMAVASSGRKQSAATIAKRVAHRIGKPLSEEHREKIRSALKGRKRPAWIIKKMRAARYAQSEAA